jgi:putative ATP-binding cassette transporter
MNHLLKFINHETDISKGAILFMAIVSGAANSVILIIINQAAEVVGSNNEIETQLFFLYLTAFVLSILTGRYAFSETIIAFEKAIAKVRLRIVNKIRQSELDFIENKGKVEIYTYLTQDTNLISSSSMLMIAAIQSSLILIFCLFYVFWLSPLGFLLIVFSTVLTVGIYFAYSDSVTDMLQMTTIKETRFFESLNHILIGFKEIKVNQKKNDDLFSFVETVADEAKQLKIQVGLKLILDVMFSRIFSNSVLGIIVFILPLFSLSHADVVIKLTSTLLFIMGSIEVVVAAVPMLAHANIAVGNLQQLEAQLDAVNKRTILTDKVPEKQFVDFKTIQLKNIQFKYLDKEGNPLFHVGPLNLTIQPGEILFIVGGNGSGKSTLLKLLTGLYYPDVGTLVVDNKVIEQNNYQAYRELFSIIFTDFHLFDRLYGLPAVDEQQLNALLGLMELEKKTQYLDGKFTHLDLSTGQKKRLAFIVTVLEDKPVYILDELAADQDPQFRKYFYERVLPDLKKQGKTIIAVTHDDKYFDIADRIIKMDYGKINDECF